MLFINKTTSLLALITVTHLLSCQGDVDKSIAPSGTELNLTGRSLFAIDSESENIILFSMIAAGHATSGGYPAVLIVDENVEDAPTHDFLERYQPELTWTLDLNEELPVSGVTQKLASLTPHQFSLVVAEEVWKTSSDIVLVDHNAYVDALIAAPLATHLNAPLLLVDTTQTMAVEDLMDSLDVQSVWTVGELAFETDRQAEHLIDSLAVAGVIDSQEYLSVTNTVDHQTADSVFLSPLASLLAARRGGAVLALNGNENLTASEIDDELESHFEIQGVPSHMALVGHPTLLPFHEVPDPIWEGSLVTDFPYGNIDGDPFLDIAIGRMVADDLSKGLLIASRISTYDFLVDDQFMSSVAFSGNLGGRELEPIMAHMGMTDFQYHSSESITNLDVLNTAAFHHSEHSSYAVLGDAFDLSSTTLMGPSVVTSSGCSTAGIDDGGVGGSIATHMLHLGAVSFIGGPRVVISETSQVISSFWNNMAQNNTIGESYLNSINGLTVNILDWNDVGAEYAKYNLVLFGDPALNINIMPFEASTSAHLERSNDKLFLSGPAQWSKFQVSASLLEDEWGYYETDLFYYSAPGVEDHSYWAGQYDEKVPYFTARFKSDEPVSLQKSSELSASLFHSESFYVDEHPNGGQTLIWHVQMLDYDWTSGDIYEETTELIYDITWQ